MINDLLGPRDPKECYAVKALHKTIWIIGHYSGKYVGEIKTIEVSDEVLIGTKSSFKHHKDARNNQKFLMAHVWEIIY